MLRKVYYFLSFFFHELIVELIELVLKSCGIMFFIPLGSNRCYQVGWWSFCLVGIIGLVSIHLVFAGAEAENFFRVGQLQKKKS